MCFDECVMRLPHAALPLVMLATACSSTANDSAPIGPVDGSYTLTLRDTQAASPGSAPISEGKSLRVDLRSDGGQIDVVAALDSRGAYVRPFPSETTATIDDGKITFQTPRFSAGTEANNTLEDWTIELTIEDGQLLSEGTATGSQSVGNNQFSQNAELTGTAVLEADGFAPEIEVVQGYGPALPWSEIRLQVTEPLDAEALIAAASVDTVDDVVDVTWVATEEATTWAGTTEITTALPWPSLSAGGDLRVSVAGTLEDPTGNVGAGAIAELSLVALGDARTTIDFASGLELGTYGQVQTGSCAEGTCALMETIDGCAGQAPNGIVGQLSSVDATSARVTYRVSALSAASVYDVMTVELIGTNGASRSATALESTGEPTMLVDRGDGTWSTDPLEIDLALPPSAAQAVGVHLRAGSHATCSPYGSSEGPPLTLEIVSITAQ